MHYRVMVHLGSLESTQEARVALNHLYLVLNNFHTTAFVSSVNNDIITVSNVKIVNRRNVYIIVLM